MVADDIGSSSIPDMACQSSWPKVLRKGVDSVSVRCRLMEELVPFMDHSPHDPEAQRLGNSQIKRKLSQAAKPDQAIKPAPVRSFPTNPPAMSPTLQS